ncbi:MAG: hypothetical protein Q7J98_00865 [Kiritimatiellia bacterium]|nr:hypothetical protein [Kiritimatiellia bacterium]
MDTQAILSNLQEIKSFFSILHEEYGEVLARGDIIGRIETSSNLSAAYALVGNAALAQKWAEEVKATLNKLYCERSNSD